MDVLVGGGVGGQFAVVVAWWGEARVGSWGVGRVLELVVVLLGGRCGVLVEPSWIGSSLVCCVSGGVFPVPDEVAASVCVFEFDLGVMLFGAGLSFCWSWRDLSFSRRSAVCALVHSDIRPVRVGWDTVGSFWMAAAIRWAVVR